MQKTFYLIICVALSLLVSPHASGQDADSALIARIKLGYPDNELNSALSELKDKKVDTVVVYYINCIGYHLRIKLDSCTSTETKYLIWKSQGISHVKKFDGCLPSIEKNISSAFLNKLYTHVAEFKISKVLYPQYTKIIEGKKHTFTTMVDHSCHFIFQVYDKGAIIERQVDDYALNTKYDDQKIPNENYKKNQRSLLKALVDRAENLTNF